MVRASFLLVATGLILGYATLRYGGVLPVDWNPCALALGLVLIVGFIGGPSAPVDRLLCVAVLAIPAWALLQAMPLPDSWIALLSPERAALARPLLHFGRGTGWTPLSVRPEETLRYALRYLAYGATFFITRDLMWRMPAREWLIAVPLLAIAILEAIVGLLQNSSGVENISVSGTFVNRDHFSAMLEMSLPFAVGLVFNFAPHGIRAAAACMGAAVAALLFAGIAVSLSRGGFFIALALLLLFVWLHAITGMRGTSRLLTVAGSVLAAGCAAVIVAPGRLLDRMVLPSHGEIPMNDRFLFWKETAHVIAAYPVFGCGFGGLVSAVTPWRASSVMRTLDYAHNDYLQFLAEGGIVPFALAAVVGAMVARSLWRGVFRQHSRQRRGFAIACAASLFAGLVHSGVDLITYVPATAMLLCWIAGMAAGLDFDTPRKGHVLP